MTKIVDGKLIAQEVANRLKEKVDELRQQGIKPKLVIVGIKPDARSQVYIRMKLKRAEEIGINTEYIDLNNATRTECIEKVSELSNDKAIDGIILQLPLAGWYDPQDLIDYIDPSKDVDGLTSTNQLALEQNKPGIYPATPLAVMKILKLNNIELSHKTVCVVGRSHLVGTPLKYLLEHSGAKVLVGHRQIKDLSNLTLQSDIVISAAGSPSLITADMIKQGAVVIDVGINNVDDKLRGDVDFEGVSKKASIITPVPGGVGPLTVVMLLKNVIDSAKRIK
jgi:methylenetetrahydrofolate dehydrogenase (NADP+)/methenyltetrahydrofolate cyclohydrolase